MPAAYQDQNGKWWKECSSTKQLFGGVDTIEELGEWFSKNKSSKDGFAYEYKKIRKAIEDEYYKKNLDKKRSKDKKYSKTLKGKLKHYKCSAKKRGINFTLTLEWLEEQMTKPEFNVCYFSGVGFVDETNHPFSRSLDRVSSTKGYSPDNVRWVCHKFNSWKCDLTLHEIGIMFKAMAQHHNVDPFEVLKKVA
jgi:hypothetical protein